MVKNKTIGYRVFLVFDYVLLALISILCLLPVVHVAFASFSDPAWVMSQSGLILWPHGFNVEGYLQVFSNRQLMGSYGNTILYVVSATAIGLLVTVLGAYPLSKKEVLFSNTLMLFVSFTMLFNGGMIPTYMLIKDVGLLNSPLVMIIYGAVNVYNLIITRTFFETSIPDELYEAATLDGCSHFRYFGTIVLPLSKAVIAVIMLYYLVGHWNDFFNALLYINSDAYQPLQIVLRNILLLNQAMAGTTGSTAGAGAYAQQYADQIKFGVIIVSTLPVLCVYPFIQKYFEKGVMIGAVKG